jgi:phosphoglycolate phosphatase
MARPLAETATSIDWRRRLPSLPDLTGVVVAFDLDGTLVDTAPDLIGTLNQVLAEQGHPSLPLADARSLIGHGARALIERGFAAAGAAVTPERLDRLWDHFIELYLPRIALESRPFPGAVAALDRLAAAGARLVVCTNKRTYLSRALLDALDLSDRFAAIVGPDLPGFAKPDPRHLTFAIEAAGGGRAVMVGDASTDTRAAQAAGVPVIVASFGYLDMPLADLGADAVIDHFDELPAAVARLVATPAIAGA